MKPNRPIQADARWIIGLSSAADSLAPSLARKAIKVKRIKKTDENPRETAMKAGVVAVGADNQRDTSLESTERSGEQDQDRRIYRNGHGRTVVGVQNRKCAIDGCGVIGS
jgi:hypothetical protein